MCLVRLHVVDVHTLVARVRLHEDGPALSERWTVTLDGVTNGREELEGTNLKAL